MEENSWFLLFSQDDFVIFSITLSIVSNSLFTRIYVCTYFASKLCRLFNSGILKEQNIKYSLRILTNTYALLKVTTQRNERVNNFMIVHVLNETRES